MKTDTGTEGQGGRAKPMPASDLTINTKSRGFFAALALVALLFAWTAVGPCLDNGFINWDENFTVVNNPRIKTLTPSGVLAIFTGRDLGMYSPLATLSYAVNYHFSGLSPKTYHATAVALHLASTVLVMALVRLLLPGVWPAFLCALFFGLHPAHVESVAWAAERKDQLYSFFYLFSLVAYALSLGGRKTYLLSLLLFLCSLLSKPMAVTLPAALILIDYLKLEKIELRRWIDKIPFFLLAGVFSALQASEAAAAAQWPSLARRLALAVYNLGFYVYTLAWPFDLSAMYVLPLGGAKGMYLIAAAAAVGAALLWHYGRGNKAVMFGAAFYAVMLLPVLQFFPFGPVVAADRYTYLSSVGVFIAAAAAGAGAWARAGGRARKILVFATVIVALVFTVTARVRCAVWRDGVSLWSDTLRRQPSSGQALVGLCSAYLQAGRPEAEGCLRAAIERYPEKDDNFSNLGMLLARRGDLAAAQPYFEAAVKLNPAHALALYSLGRIALVKKDAALAERLFLRSAAADAAFAPVWRELAGLALGRKDKVKARLYSERALAADPAGPAAPAPGAVKVPGGAPLK
ncbi:MAG TPA: tetratricopeptide repeat protein [Elusimicrobiales bacterium]|nr:tetratricopeptide repeat protein [Elusimicrobiales bacterium]